MKVLVFGGRDYGNVDRVYGVLDDLGVTEIVAGGAPGADWIAETWAKQRQIDHHIYPAKWLRDGDKAAGPIRNRHMAKANPDIDLAVGFPGGPGTKDMTDVVKAFGFKVRILR